MSIVQDLMAGRVGKYSPEQIMRGVQDGLIPAYLGIPAIDQLNKMKQQAQAMASGAQRQQPTIAQQVEAQAAQPQQQQMPPQMGQAPQGVASLPSNLPAQPMAGGGIVAFDDGGDVDVSSDEPPMDDGSDIVIPAPVAPTEGIMALAPQTAVKPAVKAAAKPAANDATSIGSEAYLRKLEEDRKNLIYEPPKDMSTEFAALLRPAKTAQQGMAEYKDLLGEDTGRIKSEERLTKMEERAKKAEEDAPWLALARAGFELASSGSVGKAGMVAMNDLAASQRRAEDLEERRFDLESRLAQAKRAEQVAAATYGINSAEHTLARNEAVKLDTLNYKTRRAEEDAKTRLSVGQAKLTAGVHLAQQATTAKRWDMWKQVMDARAAQAKAATDKGNAQLAINTYGTLLKTYATNLAGLRKVDTKLMKPDELAAHKAKISDIETRINEIAPLLVKAGAPKSQVDDLLIGTTPDSTPPAPAASGPALVANKDRTKADFSFASPQLP